MTRTDVMASSRPRTAGAAPTRKRTAGIMRRLSLLSLVAVVVMAFVGPGTALAAGSTKSGYNQTPNTPTTGTSPSKESSSPKEATSPSSEASPTTTTAPTAEKSTLPFTGFDLRWSVGAGLLLMAAGFSIVAVQRRQRRQN